MGNLPTPDDASVIDAHVHALPKALVRELSEDEIDGVRAIAVDGGWNVTLPGTVQPKLVRPLMTDLERRWTWASEQGIDRQVVSPWLDLQPTAAMPESHARDWARRLNAALAEQEADSLVLATVAIGPHSADDLMEAVAEQQMAGLILSTNPSGVTDLADPLLEPLWDAAASLRVPVVLHPPTDGPSRSLPGSTEFGNTLCRLVDTTLAIAKLLLSGVLDRHPTVQLVVVHGGGFLPYQSMRLDGGHRADALARYRIQRDRPSDYLADLYYDTVAMKPGSIRLLADSVGPDRVLLGSDYPFPLGDRTPVATVRDAGLAEADTAAVLGGNAAQLFGESARSSRV